MPLLVGTSGWQYRDWRGAFYPERLPVSQWLEYYATRFPTVENNGTFYRLPVAGHLCLLARPDAGWLRHGGEGEPVPDPYSAAARAGRAG